MSEWNISGTVLIACNCAWGCPCNFNALPTHGFCEGGWSWRVDEGRVDDVRLDGLSFSVWAKWPGAIHEGGGRALALVDANANDEQRQALWSLARGQLGGPWAIFINTYELAGPVAAEHRVEPAEHRSRLKIGDVVTLALEPMRNPVSGAETFADVVLPGGLVVKRAATASSAEFRLEHDFGWDYSGRYTAFGRFEYGG